MRFFQTTIRALLLAPVLTALALATPSARAGSYDDDCQPAVRAVVFTTYKTVCVSEVRRVIRYDHCGRAYAVKVVVDREVTVPVRHVVYLDD